MDAISEAWNDYVRRDGGIEDGGSGRDCAAMVEFYIDSPVVIIGTD